ncbi:MAG: hypothetical protein IH585_11650 [Anaerolineaceae bacterium]|nr:hypothetical protein [Anaerolineaceae bacterium]
MIKVFVRKFIIAGLISVVSMGYIYNSVTAADLNPPQAQSSGIILDQPQTIEMGETFILSGKIMDLDGEPMVEKNIFFSINGEYLGQTPSDRFGKFSREFKRSLDAGIYKISADLNRENLLLDTPTTTYLSVLPTEVIVQVTPPIPNVGFMMDQRKFYTNEEGIATISLNETGVYRLFVLDDEYDQPNQRIELGRWTEEIYEPYQDISVPTNKVIQVGLNVFQIFSLDFVDLSGHKVDPSRVSEFTIRSLQGDMFVLKNGEPRWFPASRTARRLTGLEETKLYYSVINVIVDGSNVVNQSQQRFYTSAGGNLTIELILYSLTVNAKDGLFGWTVGDSLLLEYPDGKTEEFPLDEKGSVTINSLARGTYYLNISGVKGLDNKIPVALSRDQDVNMKLITYLDITVFGIFGLLLVLGLLLYGRPWIWRSLVQTIKSGYEYLVSHHPGAIGQKIVDEPAVTLMVAEPKVRKSTQSSKKPKKLPNQIDPPVIGNTIKRRAKGVK